jgi:hypothetical protein
MTACNPAIGSGHLSRYYTPHRQLAWHGFVRVRSTRPQTMLQDADARRGRWLYLRCGHQPDGFLSGTSTSVRGFIRSAPTFRVRSRCGSTGTSGPNARPRKPGAGEPRWPTDSPPVTTRACCCGYATASAPSRSKPSRLLAGLAAAALDGPGSQPRVLVGLSMRQVEMARTWCRPAAERAGVLRPKPCSGFKPLATTRRCPHD